MAGWTSSAVLVGVGDIRDLAPSGQAPHVRCVGGDLVPGSGAARRNELPAELGTAGRWDSWWRNGAAGGDAGAG